jgi:hypothetical protein
MLLNSAARRRSVLYAFVGALVAVMATLLFLESVLPTLPFGRLVTSPADIYVSTTGKDEWSGRVAEPAPGGMDGPVATLQRAKQRVTELRRGHPERDRPIVVAIRGGTYYLDQPLQFGPEDSGTEKSPIIFRAFGDERPVLSGGVRIGHWQVTAEGHWQTTLPEVRSGKWSFAQLFVNEQRRDRPRLPKQGYYHVAEGLGRGQFEFGSGEEIDPEWANVGDVEVLMFHKWAASRMRIASVISAEHRVVFTGRSWEEFGKGDRYLVDNVREALSEPGRWYLDRHLGQLTYVPKPGEQPNQAIVIAPRLEQLVVLRGDLIGRRWVQYIRFEGLSFAHTNWTLSPTGQDFPQAEIGLNAAIIAIGARQIVFERCSVRHVGGYAMAFGSGSRNNRIERCELVDLAGGGVKVGHAGFGTWDRILRLPNDPEMRVSHHIIRNCLIAHGGRLHPGAVGIWIGQSSDNTVEHNEIFDFYQTGISVGWTWGYGQSDAQHNDIAFNHVHTIGQGVMSDMGGIYTLGIQPGTVVHDNHIHDIQSFDYGGWGLYADEGSTGIVMERNLVHHTKTGGFHQHYGRENHVRNNIFALATQFQLQATKPEPHVSFYFEHNIVYWDNDSPLFGGCLSASPPCEIKVKSDYNLYGNVTGNPRVFPGNLSLDQWRNKSDQDRHSLVGDPLLEDVKSGNFKLKQNSPALNIGFRTFDVMQAGWQEPPMLTTDLPIVPPAFP